MTGTNLLPDDDRATRPTGPAEPLRKEGDETGPSKPDVERPDRSDLLEAHEARRSRSGPQATASAAVE